MILMEDMADIFTAVYNWIGMNSFFGIPILWWCVAMMITSIIGLFIRGNKN